MSQDYLERGTVYPSEAAQARYPLSQFYCYRCAHEHLPHLVDNPSEFYWEHQYKGSGRMGCARFSDGPTMGFDSPRPGTAAPTFYKGPRLMMLIKRSIE